MPFEKGNKLGIHGGRPKKFDPLKSEKARQITVNEVHKNIKKLIEAKMDLALGHTKVMTIKKRDGSSAIEKVYQVSPDGSSIQYLLNQTIGKPKETIENKSTISLVVDF